MIVQKNFLTKLRDFGLNTYESKLWTALLSRGQSTAGELSDIATVPRSRAYDVLESLEKKGFIIRQSGKPITYKAVPPQDVIDTVKKRIDEETTKQVIQIEQLKESELLSELKILHEKGAEFIEPSELMGAITGRENIDHHIESRLSKAKSSIYILTTPEYVARKTKTIAPLLKKLSSKGVKIRIASQHKKEHNEHFSELSKSSEMRNTNIAGRIHIIDGSEVIFMLLDEKSVHPSYDTAVWVNSEPFAKAIENAFDAKWKQMPVI